MLGPSKRSMMASMYFRNRRGSLDNFTKGMASSVERIVSNGLKAGRNRCFQATALNGCGAQAQGSRSSI